MGQRWIYKFGGPGRYKCGSGAPAITSVSSHFLLSIDALLRSGVLQNSDAGELFRRTRRKEFQKRPRCIGKWLQSNKMLINCNITKEMIIGKPKSNNMSLLQIDGRQIERVSHSKILGLQLSDNLLCDRNVEYICNKVSSKLYFLKLLKRAGLSSDDLQYFYITVIRPISWYACTAWNHNLTSRKEHCGLFIATKLKECLISIYSSWLTWNR